MKILLLPCYVNVGTDIIESIQTGNSSKNTVELTATFSNDTCLNSTDVFVILADTSISINRSVYSVVRGIGTESNTIEDVSSGQYSVLVYDLGSDGLLRNSPVRPIAREMVNVSGSTLDSKCSMCLHWCSKVMILMPTATCTQCALNIA